jgi:hypothetical protein
MKTEKKINANFSFFHFFHFFGKKPAAFYSWKDVCTLRMYTVR